MTDIEKLIYEARALIANCKTYRFGMYDADLLAHEVAGRLADALEAATATDDGDQETEWEYGTGHVDDPGNGALEWNLLAAEARVADWNSSTGDQTGVVLRRRKAGPWIRVTIPQGGGGK